MDVSEQNINNNSKQKNVLEKTKLLIYDFNECARSVLFYFS